MQLAIINPKRRKGKGKARKAKARVRRSNPVAKVKKHRRKRPTRVAASRAGRTLRRRRRNPSGLKGMALMNRVMPAVTGAAGAVAVDMAIDALGDNLPDMLRTGWGKVAAKAGVAILAGIALEKTKVLSPATRNELVAGALTVTAFQAYQSEIAPRIGSGFSFAPAPAAATAAKGYQIGTLAGYQAGTLAAMPNSGMVLPFGTPSGARQFV